MCLAEDDLKMVIVGLRVDQSTMTSAQDLPGAEMALS